ncbi:unnamed protein product [Linum tenue]|uniref:DUF241 domain protein n=1 Tax=Linum tenue TaxID=586396 RepID=A0AAV0LKR7_9ROSI|nr:unnamed protein product [Linum tenue]
MASACHVRSISLPSRPHQSTLDVDIQLERLRSSQSTSSPSNLSGLKDLYESIDDFLQLQATQKAISDDNSMDKSLDRSLRLFDVCAATRDIFSQMKEILKELQSSLRRKTGSESVEAYMAAKKLLSKEMCKCLRNLKCSQRNCSSYQEKDSSIVVGTLRQAEEACLEIFESLLAIISCSNPKTKRWSLVSKLLQSKRISSCEGESNGINEVVKMERELMASRSSKEMSCGELKNLLKSLEGIELTIQEVEELGCVYKLLVKTRVSILNILSR